MRLKPLPGFIVAPVYSFSLFLFISKGVKRKEEKEIIKGNKQNFLKGNCESAHIS